MAGQPMLATATFLFVLQASAVLASHWECTATGNSGSFLNRPIQWTCVLTDNCCLTGPQDAQTGCCKDFKDEATYSPINTYIKCSPSQRQPYYCPPNRECCIIAATAGTNRTGCCVSHLAKDEASSSNGSFGETDESTPDSSSGSTFKNSYFPATGPSSGSISKVTIVVIVVLAVIVLLAGLVGYAVHITRRRNLARQGVVRCNRLQAYTFGLNRGDQEERVAFIAPPSYWENPEGTEDIPENTGETSHSPVPMMTGLTAEQMNLVDAQHRPVTTLCNPQTLPEYTPTPQPDEKVVQGPDAYDRGGSKHVVIEGESPANDDFASV